MRIPAQVWTLAALACLACEDPSARVAVPAVPVAEAPAPTPQPIIVAPAPPSPSAAPPAVQPTAPSAERTAPPLDMSKMGVADMRGHPCKCGKECHCGHCSGAIPGCHCKTKRADGKSESPESDDAKE